MTPACLLPQCAHRVLLPLQYVLQKAYILRPDKRKLVILNKMNGVLRPGRTTLLLGPPSSGKSTLLKALSGVLHKSGGLKVWCPSHHSRPAYHRCSLYRLCHVWL